MAKPPAKKNQYLFDDEALYALLADGSKNAHAVLTDEKNSDCFKTIKLMKDTFLEMNPDEKEIFEKSVSLEKKKKQDLILASAYHDQLQNYGQIEEPEAQDKIFFIAVAKRTGFTIVTGETHEHELSMKTLSEQLEVECISCEQFLEIF